MNEEVSIGVKLTMMDICKFIRCRNFELVTRLTSGDLHIHVIIIFIHGVA